MYLTARMNKLMSLFDFKSFHLPIIVTTSLRLFARYSLTRTGVLQVMLSSNASGMSQ